MRLYYLLTGILIFFISCTSSHKNFHPEHKYPLESLQKDYTIFRNALETHHPGLYWFTSKDSMDYWFDRGYKALQDSMTEPQFRNLLSTVSNQIRCGHTSVRLSKKYTRYLDTVRQNVFPLSLKTLPDWMAITGQLQGTGPKIPRGSVVTSINGRNYEQLKDSFFHYLITDGHALNGKYQSLSNRGNFGVLYRNIYGLEDSLSIEYIDSTGFHKKTKLSVYKPFKDSLRSRLSNPNVRTNPINSIRNLQIDTSLSSAYMTLNSFERGHQLKKFFQNSFSLLEDKKIEHLVIDVRSNGGGDVGLSTLLTRYLKDRPFKIADTLYAISRGSYYGRYIKFYPFYKLGLMFVTKKEKDGRFHFRYYERHRFNPINKNHYNGNVYIIIGGGSFSATTIFAHLLKGQKNVLLVGEETGGGAYGNSAWMIPNLKLPETGISFRLPLFKMIMDQESLKTASGIKPDVYEVPTVEDIRKGRDPKSKTIEEWIRGKKSIVSMHK